MGPMATLTNLRIADDQRRARSTFLRNRARIFIQFDMNDPYYGSIVLAFDQFELMNRPARSILTNEFSNL
jgi:hypothetical protein